MNLSSRSGAFSCKCLILRVLFKIKYGFSSRAHCTYKEKTKKRCTILRNVLKNFLRTIRFLTLLKIKIPLKFRNFVQSNSLTLFKTICVFKLISSYFKSKLDHTNKSQIKEC